MKKKLFALFFSALLSFTASLAEGAAYIKFDGIDGRSTSTQTIEIYSFSWGLSNPGSFGNSTAMQNMIFTAPASTGSKVLEAITAGKVRSVTLLVPAEQAPNEQRYLEVKLENVLVSSWSVSGAGADMSLSLNFEKYKTTFTEYGKDGAR